MIRSEVPEEDILNPSSGKQSHFHPEEDSRPEDSPQDVSRESCIKLIDFFQKEENFPEKFKYLIIT